MGENMQINKDALKAYLSGVFSSDITVTDIKKLGEGFHAEGFLIKTRDKEGKEKRYILKTLRGQGFGHDYPSDRANVVIRSLLDYNLLPNHIKAMDVGSIQDDDSLRSVGKPKDFFIILEEAKGTEYWKDLDEMRDRGSLLEVDVKKIKNLANYLVKIHSMKYTGGNRESLYKRVVRDFVGHGELTMGVIDTFPKKLDFTSNKELVDIVKKMVEWWEKIKNKDHRLTTIHGDFHPNNIWFDNDALVVLDRSRFRYGDPADDTTSLTMNFINYSVMAFGEFKNPFKELLELFFMEYFKKINDLEMFKVSPLFYAFRSLVCIHPLFYNANWLKKHGFSEERVKLLNESKRKIINFAKNILNEDEFNIKKINSYLKD